jgi:hypothetical protein
MLGEVLDVQDMISVIEAMFPSARGTITCRQPRNKMANHVSDTGLQGLIGPFRPLTYCEGVEKTAERFGSFLVAQRSEKMPEA